MQRRLELLCACALALAAACSDSAQPSGPPDGKRLFVDQGCATCHAADGSGTALAPTLRGKHELWTREKLVRYLVDPQAYVQGDTRLATQARKYSLPMTKFGMLSPEQLGALADQVLALP